MTEAELIARQAKQIEELRDEVADLKERARRALSHIYCVGGPLNDNNLGYSSHQMVTFDRISEELQCRNSAEASPEASYGTINVLGIPWYWAD